MDIDKHGKCKCGAEVAWDNDHGVYRCNGKDSVCVNLVCPERIGVGVRSVHAYHCPFCNGLLGVTVAESIGNEVWDNPALG